MLANIFAIITARGKKCLQSLFIKVPAFIRQTLIKMGKKKSTVKQGSGKISSVERGIALAFAGAVLVVLIVLVLNPQVMNDGTLAIVRFLAASFAGISGYLFSGTLGLEAKIPWNKTVIRATGGFATFILVLLLFFYGLPVSNTEDEQSYQKQKEYLNQANVIVAEFDQKTSTPVEIGRRIESAIEKKLQESELDNINIEFTPYTIKSEIEAQQISGENTTAVIWGWYDDYEIRVRIFLPTYNKIKDFNEIPFEIGDDLNKQIGFIIREDLPENVSFLAFLIIGQLKYINNDYVDGYKSYDIAMENIPENVKVENQELVHFLAARQIQSSTILPTISELQDNASETITENEDNLAATICGYAEAIHRKRSFAEAYNNLGVLLTEYSDREGQTIDPLFEIKKAADCLQRIDIQSDSRGVISQMFDKALELRPNWGLPKYNWATYDYNSSLYIGYYIDERLKKFKKKIKEVLRDDDSLYGAYVMLANVDFELGNFDLASTHLSKALSIAQSLDSLSNNVVSRLHTNLGQTYLKVKEYQKAETEFRDAIRIDPENAEALLALAHTSILTAKNKAALDTIVSISKIDIQGLGNPISASYAAKILESFIYFQEGKYQVAISTLKELDLSKTSFPNYIIVLLHSLKTGVNSSSDLEEAKRVGDHRGDGAYWDAFNHKDNDTLVLVWGDIYHECSRESGEQDKLPNYCDPGNTMEHIIHVYDKFLGKLTDRIFYRGGILIIGG